MDTPQTSPTPSSGMDEQLERKKLFKMLGKIVLYVFGIFIVLWALAAIAPFYFAAHPTASQTAARQGALDASRMADIQEIRAQLSVYASAHQGEYPGSLDMLAPIQVKTVPDDPETHAPFAYTATADEKSYTLCTTLDQTPPPQYMTGGTFSNGQYCVSAVQ